MTDTYIENTFYVWSFQWKSSIRENIYPCLALISLKVQRWYLLSIFTYLTHGTNTSGLLCFSYIQARIALPRSRGRSAQPTVSVYVLWVRTTPPSKFSKIYSMTQNLQTRRDPVKTQNSLVFFEKWQSTDAFLQHSKTSFSAHNWLKYKIGERRLLQFFLSLGAGSILFCFPAYRIEHKVQLIEFNRSENNNEIY